MGWVVLVALCLPPPPFWTAAPPFIPSPLSLTALLLAALLGCCEVSEHRVRDRESVKRSELVSIIIAIRQQRQQQDRCSREHSYEHAAQTQDKTTHYCSNSK